MKSVKYLLDLQTKTGMNDSELAKSLNLTQGAIGHYKHGRRVMDDETCIAVALALGVHPMDVIGAACIDRAEKSGQRSLWEVFTARMATAANVLLALLVAASVNLFLTPEKAEAAPRLASQHVAHAEDFILCKIARALRAVRAWLKRLFSSPALVPAAR